MVFGSSRIDVVLFPVATIEDPRAAEVILAGLPRRAVPPLPLTHPSFPLYQGHGQPEEP